MAAIASTALFTSASMRGNGLVSGNGISWRGNRQAVRIVCVDEAGRVLLLCWRGPRERGDYWEPPGGGMDAGERPLAAARRELYEETGLHGDAVTERYLLVHRDFAWFGAPNPRVEPFYLARVANPLDVAPIELTDWEADKYRGARWFTRAELANADVHLEPPGLVSIVDRL